METPYRVFGYSYIGFSNIDTPLIGQRDMKSLGYFYPFLNLICFSLSELLKYFIYIIKHFFVVVVVCVVVVVVVVVCVQCCCFFPFLVNGLILFIH